MTRIYAIVRADLNMSAGKIASQAGHAYLDAYLQSPDKSYLDNPTKICLGADEAQLEKICAQFDRKNVPYVKVIDPDFTISENEVILNDGTQLAAFTAVGVGPVTKSEVENILGKLNLL